MASIRTETVIDSDPGTVWQVLSDWADGPVDMAPGYVVSSRADGATRLVTFADGVVVRERLITCDDDARRIVYSVIGGTVVPEHDNAVMQVLADDDGRCRFVWSRDLLPDDLAEPLRASMEQAVVIIKRTFETPR